MVLVGLDALSVLCEQEAQKDTKMCVCVGGELLGGGGGVVGG